MNKAFYIAIICTVMLGFWGWKRTKTSITAVLPEKCVFFVDEDLSSSFKKNLISTIASDYAQHKNPQEVIDHTSQIFPEVSGMKVQICQTEKICFYVDAAKPLFLLNDQFVVCDNGMKVAKDHFAVEIVQDLVHVDCMNLCNVETMVHFVQALPIFFKQRFKIEWVSDTDILLHPADTADYVLQMSADSVVTQKDFAQCQAIHDTLPKKPKMKKKRVTYDVRFKNQIIVR